MRGLLGLTLGLIILLFVLEVTPGEGAPAKQIRRVFGYKRPPKKCKTLPHRIAAPGCIEYDPDPVPKQFDIVNEDDVETAGQQKEFTVGKGIQIDAQDESEFTVPDLKLYRYFPNSDIGNVKEDFLDTDFEMVEWPGRITDRENAPDSSTPTWQAYLDDLVKNTGHIKEVAGKKEIFVPLNYQGTQSHLESYVCNRDHGTHIRAVGFRPKKKTPDYVPFYLTTGDKSFHREYISPLFVMQSQLNLLAKDHSDPFCGPISDGVVNTASKINHILDFTFANNRLLLGMYCGILVVKSLEVFPPIAIESAKRNPSPDEFDEEEFIKDTYVKFKDTSALREQKFLSIDRIVSSTCCKGLCKELPELAAAYSYHFKAWEEHMKILYISYDNGETWSLKLVAPNAATRVQLFRGLYKTLPGELDEPDFIFQHVKRLKLQKEWDKNKDEDVVVRTILGKAKIGDKEKPLKAEGTMCAQMVSLMVVPEENMILALCRTDRGDPLIYNHVQSESPNKVALNLNYAVFELRISKFSPIIVPRKRSQRRMACTVRRYIFDSVPEYYEPMMKRAHNSFNIFIYGCDSIIYHSVNGGQTFFNTLFYNVQEDTRAERRAQLPGFELPLAAFDPNGQSVVFVYSNQYAFGQINYNREFRLTRGVVTETHGRKKYQKICQNNLEQAPLCKVCLNSALKPPECEEVLPDCAAVGTSIQLGSTALPIPGVPAAFGPADPCLPFTETVIPFTTQREVLPYYSNSGALRFAVTPMHFLALSADYETRRLYDNRKAIRFIDFPLQITKALQPYFAENHRIEPQNKWQGFGTCPTFGFTFKPKELVLDLGEQETFQVSTEDFVEVPLNIVTSLNDLLEIRMQRSNRSEGHPRQVRRYDWDVTVKALGVLKNDLDMQEDVFYGSDYSRYVQKTSNFILTTYPQIRCHTQATGNALLRMGCKKKMVAHEDFRRPQCDTRPDKGGFFNKFNFTLKDGQYDPDLVEYWIKTRPEYYRRRGKDVQVTYDYEMFGCPILPYRLDPFKPDLRILDMNKPGVVNGTGFVNTSAGELFWNDYVLIEIHGQKGFTYSQTVNDSGCKRPPKTLKDMMKRWKQRKTILTQAFKKYRMFNLDAVGTPLNIWPKILHVPCEEPDPKTKNTADKSRILGDDPYEVMRRGSDNHIIWFPESHKEVYIFLAIEVGHNGTFCDHAAFFGLTILTETESFFLISILRFSACFIGLLLFVYLGYYVHRMYSRRGYRTTALLSRLERGAWEILLRYERYLHEVKMGPERTRMAEAAAKRAAARRAELEAKGPRGRKRDLRRKNLMRKSIASITR